MRIWRRLGPLLAIVLVVNLIPMVSAPGSTAGQERPSLTYFALGDSYASGHGLAGDVGAEKEGKYGAGDVRNCRRSPIAYPYLVASALGASYTVDFDSEHHLACSGATAGPYTMKSNDATYHVDKSISSQVAQVYRFLDERDRAGGSGPVLVTITIGANDVGLADWVTRGQVSRQFNTAYGFFRWLDGKEISIAAGLTPAVHGLLNHEDVYVILTDYPNPFPESLGSSLLCNDFVLSMSCAEALQNIVSRLNLIMADQFLGVSHTQRLHVASLLGEPFSNHPASGSIIDCILGISYPDDTWFQKDCAHPNQEGAQFIADAVVNVARDLLPEPVPIVLAPESVPAAPGGAPTDAPDGAIAVIGGGYTSTPAPGTPSTGSTTTGPAVELILDTSDSMNERDQGSQTRLEVAKSVTTRLVTETLPAGVPMALRTYSGCSSSLAIPMQPLDPNAATGTIASLRASGSTPIAQSLRAAGGDLEGVSGPKIIVLVTDGEETCGGDPRAAIEALVAQDVSVHVNIVGFAIDDAALTATFQEWARIGNGAYFEASNELELDRAVTAASQLPFRVLDQEGDVVAEGAVGGEPVSVSEGTWTVEVDTVPLTRVDDVVVNAQEVTTIDLDALGRAGAVPAGPVDLMAILPSSADMPSGLVETGRRTRALPEVASNYTDAAETTQRFTTWGWQGNAVASFALPSGQEAQSGEVNGVYVSIHQFRDSAAAREALDFSLTEQAAGTSLQEITISPLGEHTRALYGPMDYGNETTILVQQGNLFIRVSAAMFDGDPTAETVAVAEAILLKVPAQQATTVDQGVGGATSNDGGATTGSQGDNTQVIVPDDGVPSSADSAQRTWTASVQVILCDASGSCQAGAGVVVDISLASGEWMGSCTTSEPMPTPWDVLISTCAVGGMPYHADFVATQDPSTIPPGYVPREESLTLHVEDIHPGGGDQAVFTFVNVRSDTGTMGPPIMSGTTESGEATLLMTFRGCPEGFDPATGDFFSDCTKPLDAPDAAFISWGGDGQGGMYITELDRQYDGAYVHNAKSATMNLRISGLAPVVRDDYEVFGVDGSDGNGYFVNLVDGESREVFVFYWFT